MDEIIPAVQGFNLVYCVRQCKIVRFVFSCPIVRNGQRRVDPLAAKFNGQNQTGKVSRQKQEYQRQGRDVNNTRQKSGSQAQVQRSKVRQSGVKHRNSRMNRRTLRNVSQGKTRLRNG